METRLCEPYWRWACILLCRESLATVAVGRRAGATAVNVPGVRGLGPGPCPDGQILVGDPVAPNAGSRSRAGRN